MLIEQFLRYCAISIFKSDENGNPTSEIVTAVNADVLTVVERMNFTFNFSFEEKNNYFADYFTKS